MEANKYPATGSLFTQKEKRSEKSPDYSGMLTLEMEVLDDLIIILQMMKYHSRGERYGRSKNKYWCSRCS